MFFYYLSIIVAHILFISYMYESMIPYTVKLQV